jgi:hypothetical protein
MALNADEEAWVDGLLARYQDEAKGCSTWEQSFMDDQVKRFTEYGNETRFSPKQWQILDRVAEKLNYAGRGH